MKFPIRKVDPEYYGKYLSAKIFEKTLGTVLKDEIDVLGIVEEAIEFEDVGMVHVNLQFNLPKNLVHHVGLSNLLLVHHLQSPYRAGVLLLSQIDVPETTTSQLFPQTKLVD